MDDTTIKCSDCDNYNSLNICKLGTSICTEKCKYITKGNPMNPDIIKIYNEGQKDWKVKLFTGVFLHPERYVSVYPTKNREDWCNRTLPQMAVTEKYNFIPTLMQSEEFKEGFWEWMFKNNNAMKTTSSGIVLCPPMLQPVYKPTPQMTLGYIIDYIKEIIK